MAVAGLQPIIVSESTLILTIYNYLHLIKSVFFYKEKIIIIYLILARPDYPEGHIAGGIRQGVHFWCHLLYILYEIWSHNIFLGWDYDVVFSRIIKILTVEVHTYQGVWLA